MKVKVKIMLGLFFFSFFMIQTLIVIQMEDMLVSLNQACVFTLKATQFIIAVRLSNYRVIEASVSVSDNWSELLLKSQYLTTFWSQGFDFDRYTQIISNGG